RLAVPLRRVPLRLFGRAPGQRLAHVVVDERLVHDQGGAPPARLLADLGVGDAAGQDLLLLVAEAVGGAERDAILDQEQGGAARPVSPARISCGGSSSAMCT